MQTREQRAATFEDVLKIAVRLTEQNINSRLRREGMSPEAIVRAAEAKSKRERPKITGALRDPVAMIELPVAD